MISVATQLQVLVRCLRAHRKVVGAGRFELPTASPPGRELLFLQYRLIAGSVPYSLISRDLQCDHGKLRVVPVAISVATQRAAGRQNREGVGFGPAPLFANRTMQPTGPAASVCPCPAVLQPFLWRCHYRTPVHGMQSGFLTTARDCL